MDTYKKAKKGAILVGGATVLLFGLALLFLPGPAIIVIPLGLAILATKFVWAKRMLGKAKRQLSYLRNRTAPVAKDMNNHPRK